MSDATTDPAPADPTPTPVVDDSVGTDEPVTLPVDDAVDPTESAADSSASPSVDDAAASPAPTDGGDTGDASDPSVDSTAATASDTGGAVDSPVSAEAIIAQEPVITAASAAGTAALPDVTGGGVPDPSSTASSEPSDGGTTSDATTPSESSDTSSTPSDSPLFDQTVSETQVDPSTSAASSSSSSDSSATPSTQESLGSAAETEAIVHTEVEPNLSDPTPTTSYANDRHVVRKHGIAWGLQEIGWVGPESVLILEEDFVALRDLLDQIITDRGL